MGLMTAVARAVCGGYGAGVGATASQAALLAGVLNIPGEALALALGPTPCWWWSWE